MRGVWVEGKSEMEGRCYEVWINEETHAALTDQEQDELMLLIADSVDDFLTKADAVPGSVVVSSHFETTRRRVRYSTELR